jgi:hypothetical protein
MDDKKIQSISPKNVEKESAENEGEDKESDNGDELIRPEILSDGPQDIRKMLSIMSMQSISPVPNPLMKKITERHIDKILEIAEKGEERAFKDATTSRKYTLLYVVVASILFVFLTIFLVNSDKELYKETLKILGAFGGGFGGGFGVKSYMDRKK